LCGSGASRPGKTGGWTWQAAVGPDFAYYPRNESKFWVEVVISKIEAIIETREYRGEGFVSTTAGRDFRSAVIDAAVSRLEKDEPADEGG
jgi:hypothetical protein